MKNKNLVSLLAIAMIALFSVTLTSCGDESEDPKPATKTDLQKVQEAIAGSTWTLETATVETGSQSYHYNGDCDFTVFAGNTALATNSTDFAYTFSADGTKVSYVEQCGSQTGTNIPYTVTQSGNVYTVTYKHGSSDVKFELLTQLEDINDTEINVKRVSPLYGGATYVKLIFAK
jgi:hypothetical protein